MKRLATVVLIGIMTLMATGCTGIKSSGDTIGSESATNEVTSSEKDTRVIKDAKGEVTIPANPKRIADLSGYSDILSILGYQVAGTSNSDAYDYTKFPTYLEDTLEGAAILGYSMQDTVDIEGVMNLNPDLIIISNVQEKMYDQLKAIAPTVMITMEQLSWKDDIKNVAKLFDKEKEAEEFLSNYQQKAQKVSESLHNKFGEETSYAAILASGGQYFVFSQAGFGSILYEDLNLKVPEGMPIQEDMSLPVVTIEGLAAIDADYMFVIGTDDDLELLKTNKVFNNLEAVKNNNVMILPSSPYFNQGYSPIGRELLLDEIPELLNEIKK